MTLLQALGIVWCIQVSTILALLGGVLLYRWQEERRQEKRVARMVREAEAYANNPQAVR